MEKQPWSEEVNQARRQKRWQPTEITIVARGSALRITWPGVSHPHIFRTDIFNQPAMLLQRANQISPRNGVWLCIFQRIQSNTFAILFDSDIFLIRLASSSGVKDATDSLDSIRPGYKGEFDI